MAKRIKKELKPILISDVLKKAWELLKKDTNTWVVFGLIVFLPSILWALIVSAAFDQDIFNYGEINNLSSGVVWLALGQLVLVGYQVIVFAVMISVYLMSAKGKKLGSVSSLFKAGWSKVTPVLVASIVVGLMVFVGLLFLIIPGIIIAFLFGLTLYIVADTKKTLKQALVLSKDYFLANSGLIFLTVLAAFGISFIIQVIVGVFTTPLGFGGNVLDVAVSVALQIYFGLVGAVLYLEIKKRFKPADKKS